MQIAEVQLIGNAVPELSSSMLGLAAIGIAGMRRRREAIL
jgi:MYXO-CTERM domain-containing protein